MAQIVDPELMIARLRRKLAFKRQLQLVGRLLAWAVIACAVIAWIVEAVR